VGASGDLVQLAHIALTLIGEGKVHYQGEWLPTAQVMEKCGLKPFEICIREGLSVTNGTSVMTGISLDNQHHAENLLQRATLAAVFINEIAQSYDDMLSTAKEVGRLSPKAVKIHLLHINKGTALEKMYLEGKYTPMEKEDYINIVTDQLLYIPPETVIERLTGDGDRRYLVAPLWSRDKISVLGSIDKRMAEKDIWQGKAL
jgi:histidine ammonia-lyase